MVLSRREAGPRACQQVDFSAVAGATGDLKIISRI
jgi:hypothetical protein